MKNFHDVSLVAVLFFACRPSAVFRTVWTVIVDAFNAVALRPLAHVSKEILKGLPSSANPNSTSSVVFKVWTSRVLASLPHALPSQMLRAVRHAMPRLGGRKPFVVFAAASVASSSLEVAEQHAALCAADADTRNELHLVLDVTRPFCNPVPELRSGLNMLSKHGDSE